MYNHRIKRFRVSTKSLFNALRANCQLSIINYQLLILLCTVSCTERIDINTDAAPPQLAIYGHITTDTMQHAINITRSSGYFATTKPLGVSHATVTISGGGKTFILTESAAEAGLYLTDADVYGTEGQTYSLNVSLDFDDDGEAEQYTASSYLPYSAPFDSIKLQKSTDFKDFVEIHMFGRLSPDNDKECCYSFHAFRNDVALTDSLSLFSVYDSKIIGTEVMYDVACYFLDQTKDKTKLAPGDRVGLRLDVLPREYGFFLGNAQNEVRGTSPFSGPPANVETNITCTGKAPANILGFFSAYSGRTCYTVW